MKTLILALAILMTGCMGSYYDRVDAMKARELDRLAAEANQTPTQASYKLGQRDGCNSGAVAGGSSINTVKKDIDKYVQDQYYKSGWDEQFAVCKGQQERLGRVIDDAIQHSFW